MRQALEDQQMLIVVGAEIDFDIGMAGVPQTAHHHAQALQRLLRRPGTGHVSATGYSAATA